MLNNILTTGNQVLILLVLIGVGFACGKIHIFDDESIAHLSSFLFKAVAPCAIIDSFRRPFDTQMLQTMGIVAGAALCYYVVGAILARILIRNGEESTKRVLRFGAVFGNCGYMGLPLQQVLFGDYGVFCGAVFIAIYNLVQWTYGLILISGDKKQVSFRKLINPGIVGVAVGMFIFLFSLELPSLIGSPITYLANLNVPVPMVISGYFLSKADLKTVWRHASYYKTIFLRLIVLPLLGILAFSFTAWDATLLACCVIDMAVPVAAATTMFSTQYKQDSETAANLVSVSTILSVITLPLMVALAQSLFT